MSDSLQSLQGVMGVPPASGGQSNLLSRLLSGGGMSPPSAPSAPTSGGMLGGPIQEQNLGPTQSPNLQGAQDPLQSLMGSMTPLNPRDVYGSLLIKSMMDTPLMQGKRQGIGGVVSSLVMPLLAAKYGTGVAMRKSEHEDLIDRLKIAVAQGKMTADQASAALNQAKLAGTLPPSQGEVLRNKTTEQRNADLKKAAEERNKLTGSHYQAIEKGQEKRTAITGEHYKAMERNAAAGLELRKGESEAKRADRERTYNLNKAKLDEAMKKTDNALEETRKFHEGILEERKLTREGKEKGTTKKSMSEGSVAKLTSAASDAIRSSLNTKSENYEEVRVLQDNLTNITASARKADPTAKLIDTMIVKTNDGYQIVYDALGKQMIESGKAQPVESGASEFPITAPTPNEGMMGAIPGASKLFGSGGIQTPEQVGITDSTAYRDYLMGQGLTRTQATVRAKEEFTRLGAKRAPAAVR